MNQTNELLEAFRYVDQHFYEMLEEVQTACSFRSVASDKAGIEGAASYILQKMEQLGMEIQRHNVENGNPVLLGQKQGETDKTLFFYHHYDVVSEGAVDRWISPPFEPAVRDGRIWGRGVSDNKGALFCRLHALQAVLAVCGRLPVNVKVFAEGDEECLSPSLKALIRRQPETFREMCRADAIIWENSRNDEKNRPWASFGVGGSFGIDLSVQSIREDAHSRMGVMLPNAAWRLVWALASLKNEQEEILIDGFYDDVAPVTEADRNILEAFPYEEEAVKERYGIDHFLLNKTGYELKERIYTQPSLTICGIDAGESAHGFRGIVPSRARARLSCRLMMNQRAEDVAALIEKHLKTHGFEDISVEIDGCVSPVRTPADIPLKEALTRAAALVYEKPLVIELAQLGGGPAGLFREAWPDIPIAGIGPANTGSSHHAPNENITLEHYKNAVKMVIALLFTY